ncbi:MULTISPECIES: helix-turn-helix transcriptional regulator [Providencia]|uniref:helix-turn-helix transcriptional regulator n=1 Tax=Providencia TaxID=586 RepID=UPI0019D0D37D|nr:MULTISPECIES: helix-turn-helix transcriptional regulator [Providencia]MBN6363493.1 helix-turn-helix domain-containing protein [Providencia huaxiensis]MCD2527831.1 helix-turn-helix transcriptional regulator [Providencia huaxiensis]
MKDRQRTRPELADFLKNKRESVSPEQLGLPRSTRRRTSGLRREEVAALAGVGLTWYTWLEQGRDIGVSNQFLDNLSKALLLNSAERQHLYLLTQNREPSATGQTEHHVPAAITRMINDFPSDYLCYVLNLHWDVLAFNALADKYFHFSSAEPYYCNFLYLLFMDERYQTRFPNWPLVTQQLLASFRRDYARTKNNPHIQKLVNTLSSKSDYFNTLWNKHEIYQPCTGIREISYQNCTQHYDYTSLTFDIDKGNRLLVYMPKKQKL